MDSYSDPVAYPDDPFVRIIAGSVAVRFGIALEDTGQTIRFCAHSERVRAEQLVAYIILQTMRLEDRTRPEDVEIFRRDIALVVRERLTGVQAPTVTSTGNLAGILIEVNCYDPISPGASYNIPVGWKSSVSNSGASSYH